MAPSHNHADTSSDVDHFSVLTASRPSGGEQQRPVFRPADPSDAPVVARTPPSATEFGPFMSVSTESDPLSTETAAADITGLTQLAAAPPAAAAATSSATLGALMSTTRTLQSQPESPRSSPGLGSFGAEATRRAKENEQRVLGELRLFHDTSTNSSGMSIQVTEADLPWWLQLGSTEEEEKPKAEASSKPTDIKNRPLIDLDDPPGESPTSASASHANSPIPEPQTRRHRRLSRLDRPSKPHTPHATPEGSPPSPSSLSPTSSISSIPEELDDDGSKPPRRRSRTLSSSPPPPSSASGSIFAGVTPSRSWFSSLLSPTRVVPALPSASSLVKPISVPAAKADRTQTSEGYDHRSTSVDRPHGRGRGGQGRIRRSPTEERLAAFVASQPSLSVSPLPPQPEQPDADLNFKLSRSSPFASHPYIPPSGAPGFAGDREWNTGQFAFEDELERGRKKGAKVKGAKGKGSGKGVKLVGRWESTVGVLEGWLADELRPHLPPLARLPHTWTLLYSLDQHGTSLNTLYTRCARAFSIPVSTPHSHSLTSSRSNKPLGLGGVLVENGPRGTSANARAPPPGSEGMLLVIKDGEGGVCGAWLAAGVRLSHGVYYGEGDAFLFSALNGSEGDVNIYKWTGRNNFVALCDPGYISFGGGDGHYGLYLNASLLEGTTHRCPTFDNEPLAKGEHVGDMVAFDCVGVEVWGVGG